MSPAPADQPDPPTSADADGVETPRRYWVGVLIVVLAILLVIGFALVTFVASEPSSSVDASTSPKPTDHRLPVA